MSSGASVRPELYALMSRFDVISADDPSVYSASKHGDALFTIVLKKWMTVLAYSATGSATVAGKAGELQFVPVL